MRLSTTAAPVQRTRQLLDHLHHTAATGSMSGSVSSVAPWRSTFLSHIQDMESPSFTLSTVQVVPAVHVLESSPKGAANQHLPRVRTVIFRGMWASLPDNLKNPADRNPGVFTSDMPTITTDARMDKIPQLLEEDPSNSASQCQSAVGGPVEAVFWASKNHTQWRFKGHAYMVGPDIESEAAAAVRSALKARMWETGNSRESASSWSWSRELTAHFGNLNPLMRGSFRNPPPGTPLTEAPEPGLALGQRVDDVHDEIARANFRVLVIVPEEVDRLDLSNPERGRRWNYTLNESGSWTTIELWP